MLGGLENRGYLLEGWGSVLLEHFADKLELVLVPEDRRLELLDLQLRHDVLARRGVVGVDDIAQHQR